MFFNNTKYEVNESKHYSFLDNLQKKKSVRLFNRGRLAISIGEYIYDTTINYNLVINIFLKYDKFMEIFLLPSIYYTL